MIGIGLICRQSDAYVGINCVHYFMHALVFLVLTDIFMLIILNDIPFIELIHLQD